MKVTPVSLSEKNDDKSSRKPEDDITKADGLKAHQYKKLNMLMQTNPDGSLTKYPYCIKESELAKHGLGLELFFTFLSRTTIVFAIMSIFAIISCIFNALGNGLDNYKSLYILQRWSLGNQDQPPSSSQNLDNFYTSQQTQHQLHTWLDFAYTIIYIFFWAYFSYWSDRHIKYMGSNSLVPANFSLAVAGFDESEYEYDDLKHFLGRYATVREVKFAKNYSDTLLMHKEEAELIVRLKIEKLKEGTPDENRPLMEKIRERLRQLTIRRIDIVRTRFGNTKHDNYPSILAFVIFETIRDKQHFIETYSQRTGLTFFQRCCGKKIDKQDLFRETYKLELKTQVDNPSNIKWENIEVSGFSRFWRLLLVYFVVFLLMILTFVIIFGVNVVSKYSPEDCAATTYTYEEVLLKKAANSSDRESYTNCFCLKLDTTLLYTEEKYRAECSNIIYMYTALQLLQIASAFVIIIVNSLLNTFIEKIQGFIRYSSLSRELSGTMIKQFTAVFINTALITLLLKANIFGFIPAKYLSSVVPQLQTAQAYSEFPEDFSPQWYAFVGAAYVNTWIINCASPQIVSFVTSPLVSCLRNREAEQAVSQREMNKNIVGPDFMLGLQYTFALNTIFVTLFYSSGIPIMLPLGTLALLIQYLVQKYLVLYFHKRPIAYDEALHQNAMAVMPVAALFHLVIAIWVYGYPLIFPPSQSSLIVENSKTVIAEDSAAARLTATPQISLLAAFLVLILLLKRLLVDPMSYLFGLCVKEDQGMDEAILNVKYSEIEKEIEIHQLPTYEIRANELYRDLIATIDTVEAHPEANRQGSNNAEEAVPLNL